MTVGAQQLGLRLTRKARRARSLHEKEVVKARGEGTGFRHGKEQDEAFDANQPIESNVLASFCFSCPDK